MWKFLNCSSKELNIKLVLTCGQSFRWNQLENDSEVWAGVLKNKLWLLKQDNTGNILYKNICENSEKEDDDAAYLRDYFQLDVDVSALYKTWSSNDKFFKTLSSSFHGIRILRQDPVENLFSFICSQNNNIVRIQQLVEKLCINYGEMVTTYENKTFYSFPEISNLAEDSVEDELRKLGFGYRAKFIQKSAKTIFEKPEGVSWLYDLRKTSYESAHKSLCSLPGVGPKVSDCVCLMSLDKNDAIPVDTHMWQVAARDYLPHLKKMKSITDKSYKEIGDFFRERFGDYAGWAQSVLFSSDLKKFQELKVANKLPEKKGKRKSKEATPCNSVLRKKR